MTLRTRKPTGAVAYPLILVEGAHKVGKTYISFELSASSKVGRSFVFDIGENSGDEYAALGPYELVELDGTFTDFLAQLEAATAVPSKDGKPNVIVIDSGTVLWDGLKDWASKRARNSRSNRALLQKDPDAEINVSSTYWNDANDRWGRMLHVLGRWPGITVIIARAKWVSVMGADGNPIAGQQEYKIESQKNLPYNATCQVRCDGPKKARIVAVRSLHLEVPADGIPLPETGALEHAVFEILGAGQEWSTQKAKAPEFGRPAQEAKKQLVAMFTEAGMKDAPAKAAAAALWKQGPCPGLRVNDEVPNDAWAALVATASDWIENGPPEPPEAGSGLEPAGEPAEGSTGDLEASGAML